MQCSEGTKSHPNLNPSVNQDGLITFTPIPDCRPASSNREEDHCAPTTHRSDGRHLHPLHQSTRRCTTKGDPRTIDKSAPYVTWILMIQNDKAATQREFLFPIFIGRIFEQSSSLILEKRGKNLQIRTAKSSDFVFFVLSRLVTLLGSCKHQTIPSLSLILRKTQEGRNEIEWYILFARKAKGSVAGYNTFFCGFFSHFSIFKGFFLNFSFCFFFLRFFRCFFFFLSLCCPILSDYHEKKVCSPTPQHS